MLLHFREQLQPLILRPLGAQDIDALYSLCQSQPDYYRHLGETCTRDKLLHGLRALPPDVLPQQKGYLGFWKDARLAAVLEIILAYPDADTVLLGFLMVDRSHEGMGLGSTIVHHLKVALQAQGYREIVLSYAEGNAQSRHFWLGQGFVETGEADEPEREGEARLLVMTQALA